MLEKFVNDGIICEDLNVNQKHWWHWHGEIKCVKICLFLNFNRDCHVNESLVMDGGSKHLFMH